MALFQRFSFIHHVHVRGPSPAVLYFDGKEGSKDVWRAYVLASHDGKPIIFAGYDTPLLEWVSDNLHEFAVPREANITENGPGGYMLYGGKVNDPTSAFEHWTPVCLKPGRTVPTRFIYGTLKSRLTLALPLGFALNLLKKVVPRPPVPDP